MTIYNNIDANKWRSGILLIFFVAIVVALGFLFSYAYNSPVILYIAVIIALVQALVSYTSGDKIALSISGAQKLNRTGNEPLFRIVENLTITAGLPMPEIYIIPDNAPNAFATGRDPKHASLALTTGLLEMMDKNELEGVIAHELSHVGNYDIRLMMIVVVLVGVITLLSDLFIRTRWFGFGGRNRDSGGGQFQAIMLIVALVAAILAPIAATLIQLAISRKREFLADASGALLTRYPEGLVSALQKIGTYSNPMRKVSGATSHLFIADPFGKKESYFQKIFSTHPPIAERIAALTKMSV
jgi:heat shock protein HtpX